MKNNDKMKNIYMKNNCKMKIKNEMKILQQNEDQK